MYLPVERTSRRFSLGSYRPLRSWYRCVTADTVYAWPSIVTLSPQWMFCKHAKVPNQKHRDELRHCVIYRVNTGAEKTVINRVAKLKRKLAMKLAKAHTFFCQKKSAYVFLLLSIRKFLTEPQSTVLHIFLESASLCRSIAVTVAVQAREMSREERTSRGPEQDAVSELCIHVDMITQGCHILTVTGARRKGTRP